MKNNEIQSANTPNPTTASASAHPMPESLFYDINQVAALLNTCPKTVRRFIKREYFCPCKALRKILIPRQQVEAFLKATCGTPKALR